MLQQIEADKTAFIFGGAGGTGRTRTGTRYTTTRRGQATMGPRRTVTPTRR